MQKYTLWWIVILGSEVIMCGIRYCTGLHGYHAYCILQKEYNQLESSIAQVEKEIGDLQMALQETEQNTFYIENIAREKGTNVMLRIQRSDTTKHLQIPVTRDIVEAPNTLCYEFVDQKVYYMCLSVFSENAVKQMETLIKKILTENSTGLVLDLRNNTGGLLNAVIDIAGLFLPKKSLIVRQKGKEGTEQAAYYTTNDPLFKQLTTPILILVNNYTASAAEILAGCLQYYAQEKKLNAPIFVVGSQTFGKGSVQEVIPLGNDSSCDCALKLTIGLYFLPDNVSIQATGVTPDFIIEPLVKMSEETMWFNENR